MKKESKRTRTTHQQAVLIGKIDIAKNGMGYVTIDNMPEDVLVKREHTKMAMKGDTVEIGLVRVGTGKRRSEGIVIRIVERGQSTLIGTVQKNGDYAFVIPDNKNFTKDIFISENESKKLKDKDRVVVKIIDWSEKLKNPTGIVQDILTANQENDIAMKEILLQNGFPLEFSSEVIQEAMAIPNSISEDEIKQRRDFRSTFTFTIDPFDAKDFDDAISFKKLQNKHYEIGVHIADVSHYVTQGSRMDKEAYSRATSVYLPDRVLPMLPEKISNELCSLRPNEDKLTFSVVFEISQEGKVVDYWIGKTIIHSQKRFTYEDAQEIIEGGNHIYKDEILTVHQISQQLRKEKFKEGAINFSSEEIRFRLDELGKPVEVIIKKSQESHQLIEELMLLANRTVSEYMSAARHQNKPIPFPYRVHDTPDLDKLHFFAAFAKRYGHRFDMTSPERIASSFNLMIQNSANIPEQEMLHTLGIRTMAKAIYTTKNIGHYGLAFSHYSHFTSPIRRYPDVLSHRILLQQIEKQYFPIKDLEQQCIHCSERERKAMDAEREANKYKQVEFMQPFIGEDFDATINGVAAFGFWAQTHLHRCEGFVSLQSLLWFDEFSFLETDYALVGKNTKLKLQMGDKVHIKVAATNLVKRQIDFEWLPEDNHNPTPKKNSLGKKKLPPKKR